MKSRMIPVYVVKTAGHVYINTFRNVHTSTKPHIYIRTYEPTCIHRYIGAYAHTFIHVYNVTTNFNKSFHPETFNQIVNCISFRTDE